MSNSRECPFTGCKVMVQQTIFACRAHWFKLTRAERDQIWRAYHAYSNDKLTVEELRIIQQEVIEAVEERITQGSRT